MNDLTYYTILLEI